MCSTCGCKGAETLEAPMTRYDEYCISCGNDSGANSNLCMKCQKMFGVKKASNRMIARLGLGAESFEAESLEDLTKDQLIDLIRGLEDREEYVKDFIDKSAESFEAEDWRERFFKKPQVLIEDGKEIALVDGNPIPNGVFLEIIYPIEGGSRADGWYGDTTYLMFKDNKLHHIEMPDGKKAYADEIETHYAESFEAQRKLTDIDRDGKPYTGQIYPDHPDLDPVKADRNKDGYMSSWERALGNQVARGMEKYKSERKPSMKRMSIRKTSRKSTSILPSVIVVGVIAAVVGSKIRK